MHMVSLWLLSSSFEPAADDDGFPGHMTIHLDRATHKSRQDIRGFLYEGVHWVAHNKPPMLDVKFIFDDVQVDANGHQTGGRGKFWMYIQSANVILKELEFEKSPPFTGLIRELFRSSNPSQL